jgi:N-acetyl sugar amidotransferase
MSDEKYQRCARCVMDSVADKSIGFNEDGICSHCQRYDELISTRVFKGVEAENALNTLVNQISAAGKSKPYDCLIGVSGGVDSTYVAYLVKKLGLRPLAVHFDNGWNSELAVSNIEKVLSKLKIDLVTYVVDWNEFKDLQLAFLKASVPDGEIPTDHAITALLWRTALENNIKYIVSGMNFATESISVPSWSYGHADWRYIRNIHSIFGTRKLRTYPHYGFLFLFYITFVKRIKSVSILNYVDYNKNDVMKILENDLGWVYYGGKHYESNYTKIYQGYILPTKFGVDKRVGHLSDLINAGQISREDALTELGKPAYDSDRIAEDRKYIQKKLGLNEERFAEIMSSPVKSFSDYKNSYGFVSFLKRLVNFLRRNDLYPK